MLMKKMVPGWGATPYQRRYVHGHTFPSINEFTVAQTMTWNLLMYSFLYTPSGPPPALPPPSNLAATLAAGSCSQVTLTWTDNSSNEDGFKIERKIGAGGTYAPHATVGANATTFNDPGLAPNTTYYYKVRAYKGGDNSQFSNEASTTTASPATAPSGLSASPFSPSQINVCWTDNANNETGFKIERKTGAGGTYAQIATVGANVTCYNDTGVAGSTTYYYRVRAYNGCGDSSYSTEANATTPCSGGPAAPSNLLATPVSPTQINLSWTDNANNETGFKIERKIPGGTYAQIGTAGQNATTFNDTGLTPDTMYDYRVKAYNASCESPYSNEECAGTWPPRPSIAALRANGTLTVDGNLSESGWSINNAVTRTTVGTPNNTVTFGVLWDASYLYVGVKVLDANLFYDTAEPWQDDSIEIYIDGNHNRGTTYDANDRQVVKGYNDGTVWASGGQTAGILHGWATISGGYTVEVAIPWSNLGITVGAGTVVGLDVGYNDDDDGGLRESQAMWAGTANNWTDTSAWGDLVLSGTSAYAIVAQRAGGPMTIDGNLSEPSWLINNAVTRTMFGTPNNTVNFGVLWDANYLYIGAKVFDFVLVNDSTEPWEDDSVEIYIDGNHNRGTSYDAYDRQLVKGYNDGTIWVSGNQTAGILHAWAPMSGHYSVEVAIPWSNLSIIAYVASVLGLDVGYNDDDNGGLREGQAMWAGNINNWTDTSSWGDVVLGGSCIPQDTVWFDDALPSPSSPGADNDSWTWVTGNPSPLSGVKAHQSANVAGFHQHYIDWATEQTMPVSTGDKLIAVVYLDPANPPSEIMLQWRSTTDVWEHRAYWGANLIGLGTDGTASRRSMGPLPAAGQWIRLEVPVSQVALEGHTLQGMAFTLYNGRATWDLAGKSYDLAWQAAANGIGTRVGHSTVFTGTEVIIWGGGRQGVFLNDGARYNLANNTWTPISQTGAPAGRWHHAAVWTGTEMIVWGGRANFFANNHFNNGAAYNPANNTWRPITSFGAPVGRSHMAAVWTGSQMLIWAGIGDGDVQLADGVRYTVGTDSWGSIGGPSLEARHEPSAVWTGTEMIVFGGLKYDPTVNNWFTFGDGARYNPANNTWTLVNSVGAPSSRTAPSALWTGTEMLIWGGRYLPDYTILNTGARYNPANNTWTPMTTVNAPQARLYHAGVWTGSEMIIWGGHIDSAGTAVNTGGLYNPSCDSWRATPATGAPTARFFGRMDSGIWTGNNGMFIYGGWGPIPRNLTPQPSTSDPRPLA
jgi:cellulose/xylan binding protein with CBM9 domain/fibronectin type III domain protein/galactose oxidase-like protein